MTWQNISLTQVQKALNLPDFDAEKAMRLMAPQSRPIRRPINLETVPKLASVLVLLFPTDNGLSFVLTRRHVYAGVHSGQISLPGGRCEHNETFCDTALRETQEELGISPASIQILGNLSEIYIPPSDFQVHPYVAYTPARPIWQPDPFEVAEVIEAPLAILFDPSAKQHDLIEVRHPPIKAPYYAIQGHKVWGATAIILSELESRLRSS